MAARRDQILDAFIELVADRGLERVSLDDVAAASGVQRSVIRHYVGNRADLIHHAVEALVARYEEMIRSEIGAEPSAGRVVRLLFGRRWVEGMQTEDRALDELMREATRDEGTRRRVKAAYDLLVTELARAIGRERPGASPRAATDVAFTIVCVAEHNVTMRALGYPVGTTRAAARHCAELIDGLPA